MASKRMLVNLDLNQNQIQNVLLQLQAENVVPSGAKEGQIWYDLGKHSVYYFDGTNAVPVGSISPATASVLGGVKIGTNVEIAADGTISIKDASTTQKGVIRIATDAEITTGTATDLAVNPKQLSDAITTAVSSAVVYKGVWTLDGANTTAYPTSWLPAKKGDLYYVGGTGPSTVDGVEWNPGDHLIINQDIATGGTITSAKLDKVDSTESSDLVRLAATQTLTNKTIDAANNTISNLETTNFKSGVVVTSVGATGTNTSLPTEKAVRDALTTLGNTKQDKVSTAVENNIATWDAAGNTKDSGKAITTTIAADGSAVDTKIPTEKAVRDAISSANGGAIKFSATNPALTPSGGVCTWTIAKPADKDLDLQYTTVVIKETTSKEEVICDITYTSASQITVKMNKTANVTAGYYTAVVIG